MAKNKKIPISWGEDSTTLLLNPGNYGFELLDYEFDANQIHMICGGKCRKSSETGGNGYIRRYGPTTRVGYYNVKTGVQHPVAITRGCEIMFPYVPHTEDKIELMFRYPVVVRLRAQTGELIVIYCRFYGSLGEVLDHVLRGEELGVKPKLLPRTFIRTCGEEIGAQDVKSLWFCNLFGSIGRSPWEFVTDSLASYEVTLPEERLYQHFRFSILENGMCVKASCIGGKLYATEVLGTDPREDLTSPMNGWKPLTKGFAYRICGEYVKVLGWEDSRSATLKKLHRLIKGCEPDESRKIEDFVLERAVTQEYIEVELELPKLLFFLDIRKDLAAMRRSLASPVEVDVRSALKEYIRINGYSSGLAKFMGM